MNQNLKNVVKKQLKNNQGFSLIEVMIIGVVLATIAATGVAVLNYREKSIVASQAAKTGEQLEGTIVSTAGQAAAVEATESMQFQPLKLQVPNLTL